MRNGSCGSAGVSNNCVTLSFHIKETFVLFLNDSRAKIIRAIIKQRFLEKFSNLVSNSASSIPRNFNLTPTCSKISSAYYIKKTWTKDRWDCTKSFKLFKRFRQNRSKKIDRFSKFSRRRWRNDEFNNPEKRNWRCAWYNEKNKKDKMNRH